MKVEVKYYPLWNNWRWWIWSLLIGVFGRSWKGQHVSLKIGSKEMSSFLDRPVDIFYSKTIDQVMTRHEVIEVDVPYENTLDNLILRVPTKRTPISYDCAYEAVGRFLGWPRPVNCVTITVAALQELGYEIETSITTPRGLAKALKREASA